MDKALYDTIIWGASLSGIEKVIHLKQQGQKVLLASRFGFPGGKVTEALSVLFQYEDFSGSEFMANFYKRISRLRYGVLFDKQQLILLHPEAVKRVCWEILTENNIELLFHVIPLRIKSSQNAEIELFGREGAMRFSASGLLDFSDDRSLSRLNGNVSVKTMLINCFFSDPLPPLLPGFQMLKKLETPLGQFVTIGVGAVPSADVETKFNNELDRLSKEAWSRYRARIKMMPVYPEWVFVE